MIETRQIRKSYQLGQEEIEVLRGIDITIERGEYVTILGPSGSGKSTLMHILGCLDIPTMGNYALDGQDIGSLGHRELARLRNEKIGFVFQQFHLLEHANAQENVELPMVYKGIGRRAKKRKASELLERVGLGDRKAHKPNELSGGQKQRVAIARALAMEPDVIFADEPTGNLDSVAGVEITMIRTKAKSSSDPAP